MTLLFLAAALTVLVSSLCSLFEATLYSTRGSALEAARAAGPAGGLADRFIRMKANIAEPTSAILILNTLANTAGATICGMYAVQVLGTRWVPAFSVALTVAILFVGEILPKTFGATHWRTMWRLIVWPVWVLQTVLSPVIRVTQAFAHMFTGSQDAPAITADEIQASMQLGRREGELSASKLTLLNAVFAFDNLLARQVMVPRTQVVYLDLQWPLEQCLETARHSQHTRFPLCLGSLENAIGLVHVKDLLGVRLAETADLKAVARPLRHVPETIPISQLLREMQTSQQHMALVADEHGSVVGVVTLENLVEQIVGPVQDEFDSEPPEIVRQSDRLFTVGGHVSVGLVNRELGLRLAADAADTVSGLLVSRVGRLLKVDDTVHLDGVTAQVLEVERGRATVVRLRIDGGEERGASEN
ncbi:MAG: hemolysin family protein [Acidobacteriota bacterium]